MGVASYLPLFFCAIFEKWQEILSNLTTGVDALAHALLRHS